MRRKLSSQVKCLSIMFLVIGLVLFTCSAALGAVVMGPWLAGVTTNSVYVCVETDSTATMSVQYGTTTSYGMTASTTNTQATTNSTYVHNIKLNSLSAGTLYHYRVVGTTTDYTFKSAPAPGTSFVFAWLADGRSNPSVSDAIVGRVIAANPSVLLLGGDTCINGAYSEWKNEFWTPNMKALTAKVPFVNAIGNHENAAANTWAFTHAPDSTSRNEGYFSFDYGDMHVTMMNFCDSGGYSTSSTQGAWVTSDVANSTRGWKIVGVHPPAYTYCSGHGNDANMVAFSQGPFKTYGVNVVLAGHNHFYQRVIADGIQHICCGSYGAPLYTPLSGTGVQVSAQSYCYAIGTVTATTFDLIIYNNSGAQIDAVHLRKGTPTPTTRRRATPTPTRRRAGVYAVNYVISNDWGMGSLVHVTIKNNTATPVKGWTLKWNFPGKQTINGLWDAKYTQKGAKVSVKDMGHNANIPPGGTVSFDFYCKYMGANAKPRTFSLVTGYKL